MGRDIHPGLDYLRADANQAGIAIDPAAFGLSPPRLEIDQLLLGILPVARAEAGGEQDFRRPIFTQRPEKVLRGFDRVADDQRQCPAAMLLILLASLLSDFSMCRPGILAF
jgi:hypothetical protein